jgi:hypothetical protein
MSGPLLVEMPSVDKTSIINTNRVTYAERYGDTVTVYFAGTDNSIRVSTSTTEAKRMMTSLYQLLGEQ